MIPFPVARLFDAAQVRWQNLASSGAQRTIESVSTDTREIEDGALFVALSGPNFDGAAFAEAAVERGARAILAQDSAETRVRLEALSARTDVPVATVADARVALGRLAGLVRASLDVPVIAITGSVGKTSTKEAVRTLGARAFPAVVASRASFNNEIGVPRTILEADRRTSLLVVEVGTNAPGEIETLGAIARPTVAVLTGVGRSHLAGLGSLEGVAREKGALFEALTGANGATCVLGHDTPLRDGLVARVPHGADLVTVSAAGDPTASYFATGVRAVDGGLAFTLRGDRAGDLRGVELTVPLLGRHSIQNVLLGLAALEAAGADPSEALQGLPDLRPARHRLEPVNAGGVTVVDDAYNANPDSFRGALGVLAERPGRRVLVAGPMGELGHTAPELHGELGGTIGAAGLDALVVVDETGGEDVCIDALENAARAHLPVTRADSVDAAVEAALAAAAPGDTVLVKASRAARLERVVDGLVAALAPKTRPEEVAR